MTAIAAPELWSHVFIKSSSRSDDIPRLFVSRSGELPLDVDVGHKLAAAIPYVNRLRALACKGCVVADFPKISNLPVPLLKTLHISFFGYLGNRNTVLPTVFDGNLPSLREFVAIGCNPFPENSLKHLSSFRLEYKHADDGPKFWIPFFAMLRDSPQLEELFLRLHTTSRYSPSIQDIHTPVTLRALQRLHIYQTPSVLTRQFLTLLNLASNKIAMRFTNIGPESNWIFPPTLPLKLSFCAVTSLEIIYPPAQGFILQGTNNEMQIRVARASDSRAMHMGMYSIFSLFAPPVDSEFPLGELWIHVGRTKEYGLPTLSKFPRLQKMVVKGIEDPICRVLWGLKTVSGKIPCPLLSTLDISGELPIETLVEVLRDRQEAGYRLKRLRLEKTQRVTEDFKLQVRNYIDELELFRAHAEPRSMELPAICTTEEGEWWNSWLNHEVQYL